jgi:Alpha-amylase, domain C
VHPFTQAYLQPYPITYITAPTLQIKILNSNANALTISKPPLLALLTNVGNASVSTRGVQNSGYNANENLMEVLTCTKVVLTCPRELSPFFLSCFMFHVSPSMLHVHVPYSTFHSPISHLAFHFEFVFHALVALVALVLLS